MPGVPSLVQQLLLKVNVSADEKHRVFSDPPAVHPDVSSPWVPGASCSVWGSADISWLEVSPWLRKDELKLVFN